MVPTATFRLLYLLVVLVHQRRKVVHFNITDAPTAAWTAQQVVNAFPDESAPEYLLRDRDSIYGSVFVQRVNGMGIKQKLISPRSPWRSPYRGQRLNSGPWNPVVRFDQIQGRQDSACPLSLRLIRAGSTKAHSYG